MVMHPRVPMAAVVPAMAGGLKRLALMLHANCVYLQLELGPLAFKLMIAVGTIPRSTIPQGRMLISRRLIQRVLRIDMGLIYCFRRRSREAVRMGRRFQRLGGLGGGVVFFLLIFATVPAFGSRFQYAF